MRRGFLRFTTLLKNTIKAKQVPPLPAIAQKLLAEQLFDANWYLAMYPDVAVEKRYATQPVLHFLEKGAKQGYSPAPWFNTAWYLTQHQDVKQAGINPLVHYIQHGASERRQRAESLLFVSHLPENQFIRVSNHDLTFNVPLLQQARAFVMSLLFQQYTKPILTKPCGILTVQVFDKQGKGISSDVTGLSWSNELNCWFRHLWQKDAERLEPDTFKMLFPAEAVRCKLTINALDECALEVRNRFLLRVADAPVVISPALKKAPSQVKVTADKLNVALIVDEFTYNSFKDEFNAVVLEPDTWRAQFEAEQPDIFFCESAWSGVDSKRRPWKGKIYGSENFSRENRVELVAILDHCRKNGIPTLFWNKEDPTHYPDRKHDFVKTAALFDYVFTSAEECVRQYKADYNLKNVFALPFATNPRLFNPLESNPRTNKIVFAGSWYANHVDRSLVMEQVLDALIDSGYQPEIYDRYYGDTDPLHIWPEKYQPFIRPGQPHDQMPAVYKSSVYGLNFNTVTESSTMFARRVFELMSSNTLVISNYAKGVAEMFGELVVFADKTPQRLQQLTDTALSLLREEALTLVLREHTYAKRWRYMLSCIGFAVKPDEQSVTLVSRISSEVQAMAAISCFEQHFSRDSNCKLLLMVSSAVADIDVAGFYQKFNRFGITVSAESYMQKHVLGAEYRPVETPYVMLFEPANAPDAAWLEKALLHLSYMRDYPVTPSSSMPYQLGVVSSTASLLAHTPLFSQLYRDYSQSAPILGYSV